MRINRFLALTTGISRRDADVLVAAGKVQLNGELAKAGDQVQLNDKVVFEDKQLSLPETTTIMLNKPRGYVVSRDGQGSQTIFELLPEKYHNLKPIGRLDKNSSGLLLLTNNGELAQELTHPSFGHNKTYLVKLDKPLTKEHQLDISQKGVRLDDGLSKFELERLNASGSAWQIRMSEGRNRQIRRTFRALGYHIRRLTRTQFSSYNLDNLASGEYCEIS